ncbi:MAG: hypothetical protein WDO71_05665 [Bacteroidota bacterium]
MNKNLGKFIDFIFGGFFSYIGAAVRILFVNRRYHSLLKDTMSNYVGMMMMCFLLLLLVVYIRYFS